MMTVLEKAIYDEARELADEMEFANTERDVVGGTESFERVVEGVPVTITVEAYWDRSNWYEFTATGPNIDIKSKVLYND